MSLPFIAGVILGNTLVNDQRISALEMQNRNGEQPGSETEAPRFAETITIEIPDGKMPWNQPGNEFVLIDTSTGSITEQDKKLEIGSCGCVGPTSVGGASVAKLNCKMTLINAIRNHKYDIFKWMSANKDNEVAKSLLKQLEMMVEIEYEYFTCEENIIKHFNLR